jgi:hypothetical protein
MLASVETVLGNGDRSNVSSVEEPVRALLRLRDFGRAIRIVSSLPELGFKQRLWLEIASALLDSGEFQKAQEVSFQITDQWLHIRAFTLIACAFVAKHGHSPATIIDSMTKGLLTVRFRSNEHAKWAIETVELLDGIGDSAAARGLIDRLATADHEVRYFQVHALLTFARQALHTDLARVAIIAARKIAEADPLPVEELRSFAEIAAMYESIGDSESAASLVATSVDAALQTDRPGESLWRTVALVRISVAYSELGLLFSRRITNLLEKLDISDHRSEVR